MKIRYCSICGSENYYCKNLCRKCYQKTFIPKRWSRGFDRCIKCETKTSPHVAFGLCSKCYSKQETENLCACGCGTSINKRGNKPRKFVKGHWLRTQTIAPNMSGENNPMFGKFGKDHPAFGHKISDKTRQERRERRLSALSTKGKPTNIEKILSNLLDELHITHFPQTVLYNKFTVDEFVPEYRLIIEANGGYWHGDTRKFPVLSKNQVDIQKRDYSKVSYLIACGHRVLVLWEQELLNNPKWCKQEILLAIKNFHIPLLQDSTKRKSFFR